MGMRNTPKMKRKTLERMCNGNTKTERNGRAARNREEDDELERCSGLSYSAEDTCIEGVLTRGRGSDWCASSMSNDTIGTGATWGGDVVEVEAAEKIKSAAFYSG